jgi:hypothetical protein
MDEEVSMYLSSGQEKRWFVNTCDCITDVAVWTGLTVLAIIQEETLTFKKLICEVFIYQKDSIALFIKFCLFDKNEERNGTL